VKISVICGKYSVRIFKIFTFFTVNGFKYLIMFPEAFKNRILLQKYIDAEALLKALEEPSPVSIRLNPSKWNRKPLSSEKVKWCENGYYLESRPSFTLDPLFHSGSYYPQEASSMFLEAAFRQSVPDTGNIRVLDLCGAPGGKSTHLSDMIGENSLLVANEVIRQRASVLAETIAKWGRGNTLVTQNDPSAFGKLPGYFDVIIVDAPCSGEGMFRTRVAVDEWSAENTVHCAERQKRILTDIWPALKENGILIYSTCTFNPGENEENIKWLTENKEAESVRLDIDNYDGINEIDFRGVKGYSFYPGKVRGEGFFISVIRKTERQEQVRHKSQRKQELRPEKRDLAVVNNWTSFPDDRILKWGDVVFAVPCDMDDYLQLYQNLKVVDPGTKIFTIKKSDYLPAHELALSANLLKEAFPAEDLTLSEALSFLKRDNIMLKNAPKGWSIVTYKGINIGFVKNLGNRVNNYFPVEWRIRMNIPVQGNENILSWSESDGI
jgi:16S rRNA C967 or C1407 C5-methylase (RsmB/RsmF family)/NOL1/NOP2/fmu family ribosome biogenesis protein